ncbi:MAG: hypothetical protein JWQ32_2218 [Marmoricola sp.]|nr:hypothetical protein [Marmoricola sp.]
MKRVSQHYKLGRGQESLEFVDVDIRDDVPLFIDPGAIRLLPTTMARECVSSIQSFFGHVLDCIRAGNHAEAKALLSTLSEPNETRLGFSDGKSGGHGMGDGLAEKLWDSLRTSRAVSTGVLQDLEETALFVEGIDRDIISDIVTNIITGELIAFTQTMAAKYGIPLKPGIALNTWDRRHKAWVAVNELLPVAGGMPLLLVPRMFVRRRRAVMAADKYFRFHIVPYLQHKEFNAPNGLRRLIADGSVTVAYKKTVMAKYPGVKVRNVEFTEEQPGLLEEFRQAAATDFEVVDHPDLAAATQSEEPDFEALLADVLAVTPGDAGATAYHRAVEKLLTALLYPALDFPEIEYHLHDGRKRIDIQYTNIATKGFFHWLHAVHNTGCAQVPVECKNYSKKLANPEYDQLSSRFGVQRGQVGILCYRGFVDKKAVIQHCIDTAKDGRGYTLALDDEDLKELVAERIALESGEDFRGLFKRFQKLL